jgi:hypothetical protein
VKPADKKWGEWYAELERAFIAASTDDEYDEAYVALESAQQCLKERCAGMPIIGEWWGEQGSYVAMRLDGLSHAFAEMLATQSPPMSHSDREFLEGTGEQFAKCPHMGNYYRHVAEQHGKNVKGHVYMSSLAAFPGDPEAWITGRGDAKALCEKRGWECDGSVKVKGVKREVDTKYRVADDIVAEKAADLVMAGAVSDPGEAMHVAREKLSPKARPSVKDL